MANARKRVDPPNSTNSLLGLYKTIYVLAAKGHIFSRRVFFLYLSLNIFSTNNTRRLEVIVSTSNSNKYFFFQFDETPKKALLNFNKSSNTQVRMQHYKTILTIELKYGNFSQRHEPL